MRFEASRRQLPACRRVAFGRRGPRPGGQAQGWPVFCSPTGWTVFHLPSTPGCWFDSYSTVSNEAKARAVIRSQEHEHAIKKKTRARLRLRHADRAASPPPPLHHEYMIFGFSWARSSGPAASLASFCGGEHGCISSLTVGHPEAVCFYIHDGRRIGNGNASPPNNVQFQLRLNALYLCVIVDWCSKIFRSQTRTYS